MEIIMQKTPLLTVCVFVGLVIGGFLSLTGCVATTNKAPVDGSYRVNELRGN